MARVKMTAKEKKSNKEFFEALKLMEQDSPEKMAHVLMPLFAPRLDKTFSMKSIDNMLTLKSDDKS